MPENYANWLPRGEILTYDELFAWLTKPDAYAPGTRMAFPGIKNEKLRLDVIAYLRTLSHTPEPLPEAQTAGP